MYSVMISIGFHLIVIHHLDRCFEADELQRGKCSQDQSGSCSRRTPQVNVWTTLRPILGAFIVCISLFGTTYMKSSLHADISIIMDLFIQSSLPLPTALAFCSCVLTSFNFLHEVTSTTAWLCLDNLSEIRYLKRP